MKPREDGENVPTPILEDIGGPIRCDGVSIAVHSSADGSNPSPRPAYAHAIASAEELRDIGRIIKRRYRLEERIGAGGMGGVFRATDLILGSTVAVKRMMPSAECDDSLLARFRREATLTAQVEHPCVVKVFDVGEDEDGHPYFVEEFLSGRSLDEVLKQEGRLRVNRVVQIGTQVVAALEAAHAKGILHRDIKPRNVMVLADDTVKLVDFGVAKNLRATARGLTELTGNGYMVGTLEWLEPEVFTAKRYEPDARADVYAAGLLLYVLLVAELPFKHKSGQELAAAKQSGPLHPRMVRPDIPDALDEIVARATTPIREERYGSASDLRQALIDYQLESLDQGTRINGRYIVRERLGRGGQGVVYRVEDEDRAKEVALKLLLNVNAEAEPLARFAREARLGMVIAKDDPLLVSAFDMGQWRDRPYFTMELLDSSMQPLSAVMDTLSWPQLVMVAGHVARALDKLARHDVVHRDLSPQNILVGGNGERVKVIDLGLARELKEVLTKSSLVELLGSPGYVPPEQFQRPKDAVPRSDQWALAAILYEALTGTRPYFQDDEEQSVEQEAEAYDRLGCGVPLAPPHQLNDSVSAPLSDVLMRALASDPEARFPSSSDFVARLEQVTTTSLVLPRRAAEADGVSEAITQQASSVHRSRFTTWQAVIAITALVLLAGGAALTVHLRPTAPQASRRARTPAAPRPRPLLPATAAKSDPPLISRHLQAHPSDATVVLDGQPLSLPLTLTRPAGSRISIEVTHLGYKPQVIDVAFAADGQKEVLMTLHRDRRPLRAAKAPPVPPPATSGQPTSFVLPSFGDN